ncbi:MAG: DEAD/DEAH box helicase [Bernardetiaceae bacterium]|nr:DEAD/DEAH box helicase [Bernardetiaceae bacterium]
MNVSPNEPFQIVYAAYKHEYLGVLFDSFVVQLDAHNYLTLKYQNISSRNAKEFDSRLTHIDYELIKLMDEIQQEAVVKKFSPKKPAITAFFLKIYNETKGDKAVQNAISHYIDTRKAKILPLLKDKLLFIMGKDGTPTYKRIYYEKEPADILFQFFKNENNTHYFPTIKHQGKKLEFRGKHGLILCETPAWIVVDDHIYHFKKYVDGNKLKPFIKKKFIVVPKNIEEQYFKKFVAPLIEAYPVSTNGFEVIEHRHNPQPILCFQTLKEKGESLFGVEAEASQPDLRITFDLMFEYATGERYHSKDKQVKQAKFVKDGDNYVLHRTYRAIAFEQEIAETITAFGLTLQQGRAVIETGRALQWIGQQADRLEQWGVYIEQTEQSDEKQYFIGKSSINLQLEEAKDWFDIQVVVYFGAYRIPFLEIRKYIVQNQRSFELPNGKIAVIPQEWFTNYADFFGFTEADKNGSLKLKKYYIGLVQDLESHSLAQVRYSEKFDKLRKVDTEKDYVIPEGFKGDLRPYQKAGYNWMRFLQEASFSGCLADDMGLGKTVQTLALLQAQKEQKDNKKTSLLVLPTSLLYNWQLEAQKFAPLLNIKLYTGTDRNRKISYFKHYDLVLTSYGIARIDVDILKQFEFNYIILDESQAIKNPNSSTAKALKQLNADYRLALTGTPVENSSLDLWSQMSFLNPGLLGGQTFFKKHFQVPIEKKQDSSKKQQLLRLIKPFILRRTKSQVASDLPPKVEQIQYCTMSEAQEKYYEKAKSYYRNQILEAIEMHGRNKSQIILLQGLSKLRQIANHPAMVDETYEEDSGKMNELLEMLDAILTENHKILIFSQFVKHLKIVKKALKQRNIKFAYLDGSTTDRQAEVKQFQENPEITVFLLSIKAGGVGLNLTAADYVFVLDPWWNPAVEAQAIDRAHRIGQDKKVFIYKFITQNTVEEKILKLQVQKKQLAEELITVEESFVKSLSSQDIDELFK